MTLAVENRSTFRLRPRNHLIKRVGELPHRAIQTESEQTRGVYLLHPRGYRIGGRSYHLYNMLSNLIDNAIKYADKEPCRIEATAQQDDHETTISITDNGPGISEANQRQIFDKFFPGSQREYPQRKRLWPRLYYVKDMMGKHGGTARVESVPGKGSTFTLHFK